MENRASLPTVEAGSTGDLGYNQGWFRMGMCRLSRGGKEGLHLRCMEQRMKRAHRSQHALLQMVERGATQEEGVEAIRFGEQVPAKRGRQGYRKNFRYERLWGGRYYAIKQVLAIVADEPRRSLW